MWGLVKTGLAHFGRNLLLAGLCALIIGLVLCLTDYLLPDPAPLLVASMGASVLILLVTPDSPSARFWALCGGQLLAALVGLIVLKTLADPLLASMLAMFSTLLLMQCLDCLHPPGAATALSPLLNTPQIEQPLWFLVTVVCNLLVLWVGVCLWRLLYRRFH